MSTAPETGQSKPAMPMGFGLQFESLYRSEGLARIDELFRQTLHQRSPALATRLAAARGAPDTLGHQAEAELLLELGPHLEAFVGELFLVNDALAALASEAKSMDPFFRVKWKFVRRQAVLQIPVQEALKLDGEALRARLISQFHSQPATVEAFEAQFVQCVSAWQKGATDSADAAQWLECARRYAAWAAQSEAGQLWHEEGRLFRFPVPRDPLGGPATGQTRRDFGVIRHLIRPGHERHRDGFNLTDAGGPRLAALDEAKYCLHCHQLGKDSCSKGLPLQNPSPNQIRPAQQSSAPAEQTRPFQHSSSGTLLAGCPLEQRISEFLQARTLGLPITALALITIENPLCAATGHRICNDCSNACIFQQQTPVDIPRAETRTLRDILELPWGFEIYSLLTRWNPLNLRRPLPRPASGYKVLVAGLGPAGFTLAHHLLQEGHEVFAIDGMKIEPLGDQLVPGPNASGFAPVLDADTLFEPLATRIPQGFGGVAEYGITARWDKNFLTIIRLLLERRHRYAYAAGVRLGGTLTMDDAFALGFDHVALATGAGAPTVPDWPGVMANGVRLASDFLMGLQSTGAALPDSIANLQLRMPVVVIGAGLTAIDTATEAAAYYIVQVERFLARQETLDAAHKTAPLEKPFDPQDQQIVDEFLAHGRAVRAEREAAALARRPPHFGALLQSWGGVSLAYRRTLLESPAWRLNPEEIEQAMAQGISILEDLIPLRIETDASGAAQAAIFTRRGPKSVVPADPADPAEVRLPARAVLIAAGTRPNTIAATEPGNSPLRLAGQWFVPTDTAGHDLDPLRIGLGNPKPAQAHVLAGQRADGRFVSFFGDLHPNWSGSVVKAMASALRGYPVIGAVMAQRPAARPISFNQFSRDLHDALSARVVRVDTLAPGIVELVVRAPMAARQFRPGQFFRLQNFSRTQPGPTMEPLAMTGAWVDAAAGLVGMVILETGGSANLCTHLRPGQTVLLMGPTGTPTEIPTGQTVVLVGGGLGNAVLFSIGAALRQAGSRVVYFAGYRRAQDRFRVPNIEAAADCVVWCCEEAPGFLPNRAQDRSFQGNVVAALLAYGAGELGPTPIALQTANRLLAIGSDRMMAAVARASEGALRPYLAASIELIGSINSPMQCMLKAVCGQCVQSLRDPKTGVRRTVFCCQQQDQRLDEVDFSALHQRLSQNRLQEWQAANWLETCVSESKV